MEAHSCALASKSCIGESLRVETVETRRERIPVGREGSKLGIGVHVLVCAWHTTLRLAMGGEAALVIWRCYSRPPAEAPKLRRRHVVVCVVIVGCLVMKLSPSTSCGLAFLRMLGRFLVFILLFLFWITLFWRFDTRRILFYFRTQSRRSGCWYIWRRSLSRRRVCGFSVH